MSENNNLTYYQRNKKKKLNKAKDYYKNLSEEDKIKKREYAKNRANPWTNFYMITASVMKELKKIRFLSEVNKLAR